MVLSAAPTFTFSLLIMYVAVARWNLWGVLLAPVLAAANYLGGRYNDILYLGATYDWKLYLSTAIGLMSVGLNVIFFKKFKTKKVVNQTWAAIGLILLDYVVFCLLQFVSYRLLTSGSLMKRGYVEYVYTLYNQEDGGTKTQIMNLCYYGELSSIYNTFGLAVAIIGVMVLRSQGVINNVVDKLIEDKEIAEQNRIDEQTFSIEEVEEDEKSDTAIKKEDSESSNTTDSEEN